MAREDTVEMTAETIKAVVEAISNKVATTDAIKDVLGKPTHTITPTINSSRAADVTPESTTIADKAAVEDIKVEGMIDSMARVKEVLEEVLEEMILDETRGGTTMAVAIRDDRITMAVAETTEEIIIVEETSITKDVKIVMVEDEMIVGTITADTSNRETMAVVVMIEEMTTKEDLAAADHKAVLTTTCKTHVLIL